MNRLRRPLRREGPVTPGPARLPTLSEALAEFLPRRDRVRAALTKKYGADMVTEAMVTAVLEAETPEA
jgi:hypothetical protein